MSQILVVDDDHSVLEAIGEVLKARGHHVSLAPSPDQALDLITQSPHRFSLILLDWKLNCPLDGDMLLELLKHKIPDFKTPIIAITAHTGIVSKYFLRLGAFDTLKKPFSAQELTDAVDRALGKKPLEDPHRKAPAEMSWQAYRKNEIARRLTRAICSTGSLTEAARILRCSEMTLHRWLKLTGIQSFLMKLKKERQTHAKDTP